jgi:hypothetical protein
MVSILDLMNDYFKFFLLRYLIFSRVVLSFPFEIIKIYKNLITNKKKELINVNNIIYKLFFTY